VDAAGLITFLNETTLPDRTLLLTTETTGKPALAGLDLASFSNCFSINYSILNEWGAAPDGFRKCTTTFDQARGLIERLGPFDLAFMDPFHLYADSRDALRLATAATRSGWLVVHDCLPSIDMASEDYAEAHWSGGTFAAFLDLALDDWRDRAWFVVDSDFGIGVVGPEGSGHLVADTVAPGLRDAWRTASLDEKRRFLEGDRSRVFRPVAGNQVVGVIQRVLQGEPVRLDGARREPVVQRAGSSIGLQALARMFWPRVLARRGLPPSAPFLGLRLFAAVLLCDWDILRRMYRLRGEGPGQEPQPAHGERVPAQAPSRGVDAGP
jgi:hypothetical protein